MWPRGRDLNGFGEPIWLLEPRSLTKGSPRSESGDLSASFLGGTPIFYRKDDSIAKIDSRKWLCSQCHDPLLLMLQIYAPMLEVGLDRSLYVFACNRFSCWRSLFEQQRFHSGGDGVVICIRSQQPTASTTSHRRDSNTISDNSSKEREHPHDWADPYPFTDDSVEQLELLIAALEAKDANEDGQRRAHSHSQNDRSIQPRKSKARSSTDEHNIKNSNNDNMPIMQPFTKIFLETLEEPPDNDDTFLSDDKDDHLGLSNVPDDDLQQLISKYLEQEDDQEIKSILSSKSGMNQGNIRSQDSGEVDQGTESYEQLDPEQRAFFTFLHRIRRAPSQSIRYAYGASPLWSIPTPLSPFDRNRTGQKTKEPFRIPHCVCGCARCFEFQIIPTVMHQLKCDDHAKALYSLTASKDSINWGMHWGVLAVYSCADSCAQSREEFVVIQKEPADDDSSYK